MFITWILERSVFSDNHDRLAEAANAAGHQVIDWNDDWWQTGKIPSLNEGSVIFHGSLGNASRIPGAFPWHPGAFCNTVGFACSVWYSQAHTWLLHEKWSSTTVADFVDDPQQYLKEIGTSQSFFVRPNSPLKPFSGRVIQLSDLSLEALDYGFYYDDINLPIVVTPAVEVGAEYRFVIADGIPVACSTYEANIRLESKLKVPEDAIELAKLVAKTITPPDPVYILDICESAGKLKVLELNPFSGADLYNCDRRAIVEAVEHLVIKA